MQGKPRSHLELQMVILETIAVDRDDPHLFTQILYKTAMNAQQTTKYLKEMAKLGFLTIEPLAHARILKNEYKITDNGRILLSMWTEFKHTREMLTKPEFVSKLRNGST